MEEPDHTPTPHTNESSGHYRRGGHKPPRNLGHPSLPRSDPKPSNDKPKLTDAHKSGTIGSHTTPSTPRSASPDSKAEDSPASRSQRKRKPKPEPSDTLSTKESERIPGDAKPPPTKSDFRQRQSRKRPAGDIADASGSKPPRRGKEVEPPHEEPGVDSGPIHDSADVDLPPLEHDAPRRKRQGNFDRRLTAADDKPRREERHANPPRGKYWVDYAADDLASRLIHDLRTSPYLDCIICYNPIRPLQPTWSCSPSSPIVPAEVVQGAQYCWVTLHLKCVRSWASKNIADTLQAYKARGENKPGDWLCIGCRAKRLIEPSPYKYVRLRLFISIHY